jgi:PilZ domain
MNELQDAIFNRRADPRIPCFKKAHYVGGDGHLRRSEILNTSHHGARLTTSKEVKVGDRFRLLDEEQNGACQGTEVLVRWAKPLPGGVRLVVGVEKIL